MSKSLKFWLHLSITWFIIIFHVGCPNVGPSAEVLLPWGSQESCCCRYFNVAVWFSCAHRFALFTISGHNAAMPELLRSAKLAVEKGQAQGRDQSYVKQLSDYIIPALVEALHKVYSKISQQFGYCFFTHADTWTFFLASFVQEPETEMCSSMLDSLNECMQVCNFAPSAW